MEDFERAGKERIEGKTREKGKRVVDGVIHKPKRIKWQGTAGPPRAAYQGKRQKRISALLKRGVTALTSKAFQDVYAAFHRMNAHVNELELTSMWRIVLGPFLRKARSHYSGAIRNVPNYVTPYVLAVVASHYYRSTDRAATDIARAFQVRRDLWSFLQRHIPTTREQANLMGFEDCWLEGLPYPERFVGYTNGSAGVDPVYVKLVNAWVQNPNQRVWLRPSPPASEVGFVPVYEYRERIVKGKKERHRVQVNVELNARARRKLARLALNGANGEATGKDDVDILKLVRRTFKKETPQQCWMRCVSELLVATGSDDVCDIIHIGSHLCDYRVLAICPECHEMAFEEDAIEMEATGPEASWCQEWYAKVCGPCMSGFAACTTLNGANGEATNKDDVKGRSKGKNQRGKNKPKGKRSNTQLVIVRNNSRRLANAPRPATNLFEKQYRLALFDPFHPQARGAKCTVFPWQYTVPFTIRWKAQLRVPASGSNLMIFQPNPSFYGWSTVLNTVPTMLEPVLGPIFQVPFTSPVGLNGALVSNFNGLSSPVYEPAIAQSLASFRVVAGGLCVRSILRNNVAQGLSVAVPVLMQNSDFAWTDVVSTDYFNRSNATGNTFWTENQNGCNFVQLSMLGSTYNSTNILTMGGAASFTTYDLMMNEAVMRFTPVTPEAFKFHDCGYENPSMVNTAGVVVGPGDIATYDMTTYNVQDVAKRGITDCDGWSGVILRNSNPSTQQEFFYELDYVLHIEGQPKMAGGPPPSMGSDIPPTQDSVILNYARDIKNVVIETITHAAATAGRAGVQAAIHNLQTAMGGTTRARARIL